MNFSLLIFLSTFVFFASIDFFVSGVTLRANLPKQWLLNVGLFFVGQLALFILPISAFAASTLGNSVGTGLMPMLKINDPILGLVTWALASTLVSYLLHVASHKFPWLWAFHRVHHCDEMLNASSGIRHHPIEYCYSIFIYSLVAFLLAPPPDTIVIWYGLNTAIDFFTHSKITLPQTLNSLLETIFITPALHRVHHSALAVETDSNYGGVFSFWDRLFGTFQRAVPSKIGLDSLTLSGDASRDFDKLLSEPFRFILNSAKAEPDDRII